MAEEKERIVENDKLDFWQYRIFRWVLFLLFLVGVYKLLDKELHITQFVLRIIARLGL